MDILEFTKQKLDAQALNIDEETGMIHGYTVPNYHSNLKPGVYHTFTNNVNFALSVFASEYEKFYPTANEILRKAIACQCRTGECTGLWPYFYEESLEEMVAPDWNMAEFNTYPMATILRVHKDKLEPGMYELLSEACLYACQAIQKRNLTVLYTNPVVMSIYITALCGELLDKQELIDYSIHKLTKFYLHIMNKGSFDEYNCTGYTLLIVEMFGLILRYVRNEEVLQKTRELNDLAWTMMGEHFHYATGEIAGPNFRKYVNFMSAGDLTKLQTAVSEDLQLVKEKVYSSTDLINQLECPEHLKPLFLEKNKEISSMRLLSKGFNYPYLGWPLVDTQYVSGNIAMGSFNMMGAWNQHLPVTAYLGNREEKFCIRWRVYHDNYDFSSGHGCTVQVKGTAITVTNFHTNRGDTHMDLDPIKDATIKATDLRVRYQIEANAEDIIDRVTTKVSDNVCTLDLLGTKATIGFAYAEFTGEKPYFEVTRQDKDIFVDMVLYHGAEKTIHLDQLDCAAAVSYLAVGENEYDEPIVRKEQEFVVANWNVNGKSAEIRTLLKPMKQIPSVLSNELYLDGENLIHLAERLSM